MIVEVDGGPAQIVDVQSARPGGDASPVRTTVKHLLSGEVLDKSWESGARVRLADVERREMTYAYPEGTDYIFMDGVTGEQITVAADVIDGGAQYMTDGMALTLTLYKGQPLLVELPTFVVLEVIETQPGNGAGSGSGTKPATLATGAQVQVPLSVDKGDHVKIDTRDGRCTELVGRP